MRRDTEVEQDGIEAPARQLGNLVDLRIVRLNRFESARILGESTLGFRDRFRVAIDAGDVGDAGLEECARVSPPPSVPSRT